MSENIVGKRLDYIDVSKGFGIILVIVGHISYTPELMGVWLSAFHMPLFFFLQELPITLKSMNRLNIC